MRIFVVMPAYNEAAHIPGVLKAIPAEVEGIIVVDDSSSDNTEEAASSVGDPRVHLVRHERNRGVGAAMVTGYKKALEAGADVIVKLDADGQMDPRMIAKLVKPIADGVADYAKAFRFHDATTLRQMPRVRLFGNLGLSFLTKLASGYWNIFDPTNGFTAVHCHALEQLDLDKISEGYFFESDMLAHLYRAQAVVRDVHLPTRYANEESQLSVVKVAFSFPWKLVRILVRRILWRYFTIDFTACSLFLVFGIALFLFGFLFGISNWISHARQGILTPPGTVMLAAVPLFLGFQLLLQALVLDIGNVPSVPIQSRK